MPRYRGAHAEPTRAVRDGGGQKIDTLLDLCVSSLRRGHANLLCIVPILTDDPRRESNGLAVARARELRNKHVHEHMRAHKQTRASTQTNTHALTATHIHTHTHTLKHTLTHTHAHQASNKHASWHKNQRPQNRTKLKNRTTETKTKIFETSHRPQTQLRMC